MAELKSIPLAFDKGLNREFDTDVAERTAKRLLNWEPQPDGGLRARRMWVPGSMTGVPVSPRKPKSIGHLPVMAGYETPLRRQRAKRMKRGGVTTIERNWYWPTIEDSLLIAVVVWSNWNSAGTHTNTSTQTCTPPAGWTSIFKVSDGHPTPSLTMEWFKIEDAAERGADGAEEIFTFSSAVMRAVLELQEWRGVATASAQDVTKSAAGLSIKADTGASVATSALVPKQIVLAAVAARTTDESTMPDDFPDGYFEYRDRNKGPHRSVGKEDFWLNVTLARKLIFQSFTQRFYGIYDTDNIQDDAYRWVAGLVTFKSKARPQANNTDYYLVDHEQSVRTHELLQIDLDQIAAGAWTNIRTFDARDGSVDNFPLDFAPGMGGVFITAPDLMHNQATDIEGSWFWTGDSVVFRINRSPMGRFCEFHQDRFYVGGAKEFPNRLYWSRVGDMSLWDREENYAEIGADGEPLLDGASVMGGLLVAKREGLFFVQVAQGSISKLPGGNGTKGRCICPIPGGALIAGEHHIWLWGGGAPKLISRSLDDWWAGVSRKFVHTAYVNGLVYILGALEDTCIVYDTAVEDWWVDKPPELLRALYSWNGRELLAVPESSTSRFSLFKRFPGTNRDKDSGVAQTYEALTQEMMIGTPSSPCTPKHLYIAYNKRNYQAGHPVINVTPYYDGVVQTVRTITEAHPISGELLGNGDHRIRLDVGVKAKSACHKVQFKIEYVANAGNTTTFDVEAVELHAEIEEVR